MSGEDQGTLLEKTDLKDAPGPGQSSAVVTSPPAYSNAAAPAIVGGPVASRPTDPSLNTVYMSIFAMLFCCWPCGLVGLIYGIQGMQEYYRGEYDSSERTEKKAKVWAIASIVSGVLLIVGIIFFAVVIQAVVYGVIFGGSQTTKN